MPKNTGRAPRYTIAMTDVDTGQDVIIIAADRVVASKIAGWSDPPAAASASLVELVARSRLKPKRKT